MPLPNLAAILSQVKQAEEKRKKEELERIEANKLTVKNATEQLIASGLFKAKTDYLLIGDEPKGVAVLNLQNILKPEELNPLKEVFVAIPRDILKDFFNKEIVSELQLADAKKMREIMIQAGLKPEEVQVDTAIVDIATTHADLLWGGIIDLFNVVNLAYVTENKISPDAWEKEKRDAYILSQDKERLKKVEDSIKGASALSSDPQAVAILEELVKLPPISDEAMEISRQNAVRQLLIKKEYAYAKALIDVYRYAMETELGAQLTKPLPFNVTRG